MKKSKTHFISRFITSCIIMTLVFFSVLLLAPTQTASAAPPRCFNHDGTQNATCQNIGVQLADDRCYTESRGGPNGTLVGYNETSCTDATDRDQDGNPGGAGATNPTPRASQPEYQNNDCNEDTINKDNCGIVAYIVLFINILSGLAGVAIVGSMIYGGIQYSSAGSDPQKVSAAKGRIRNAIVALIFFLFGYGMLNYLVPGGVL